jgi:hypothetical protein
VSRPTSQSAERASLRRATRAAAAAPNRISIGGAGTGVPPVEVDPPLEVDELVLELVLELLLLDVLVLLPPKLLDEEVDETLPLDVELELPLVEVEPPLVEVDPPLVLDVDETPPLVVEMPPLEVEVEAVTTAVLLPPPKKAPLKKPPPKPLPLPPPPPITTGMPPPPMTGIICGTGAGA